MRHQPGHRVSLAALMFSGRNRSNVRKLRAGCPEHPQFKGKGEPPVHCDRCRHNHTAWDELVSTMTKLLQD